VMAVWCQLPSRQSDLAEFDVIASHHQQATTYLPAQARQNGSHHLLATDLDQDIKMLKVPLTVCITWLL